MPSARRAGRRSDAEQPRRIKSRNAANGKMGIGTNPGVAALEARNLGPESLGKCTEVGEKHIPSDATKANEFAAHSKDDELEWPGEMVTNESLKRGNGVRVVSFEERPESGSLLEQAAAALSFKLVFVNGFPIMSQYDTEGCEGGSACWVTARATNSVYSGNLPYDGCKKYRDDEYSSKHDALQGAACSTGWFFDEDSKCQMSAQYDSKPPIFNQKAVIWSKILHRLQDLTGVLVKTVWDKMHQLMSKEAVVFPFGIVNVGESVGCPVQGGEDVAHFATVVGLQRKPVNNVDKYYLIVADSLRSETLQTTAFSSNQEEAKQQISDMQELGTLKLYVMDAAWYRNHDDGNVLADVKIKVHARGRAEEASSAGYPCIVGLYAVWPGGR